MLLYRVFLFTISGLLFSLNAGVIKKVPESPVTSLEAQAFYLTIGVGVREIEVFEDVLSSTSIGYNITDNFSIEGGFESSYPSTTTSIYGVYRYKSIIDIEGGIGYHYTRISDEQRIKVNSLDNVYYGPKLLIRFTYPFNNNIGIYSAISHAISLENDSNSDTYGHFGIMYRF